jgi:F-type H+-transporting ATPase subunit b
MSIPLALSAALFLSAPAFAQGHPEPAAATTPVEHTEASHAEAPAHTGAAAHEGHAAAGEENAHHAEVKLFGKSLGPLAKFLVQVFNFAIFAGLLVLALKGALASAFKARAKELEDQLNQAEKDKAEGERQLKELEAKMAGLQTELEGILTKAEADAEHERQRILDAAKAESVQILAQAQTEIDFQKRQAEKELRALVAELAVEGATKKLEAMVQGKLAEQVVDRAIDSVGGAK